MDLPHPRLLLFSSLVSFLACFCVGYNLAALNVPIAHFTKFINVSQHDQSGHWFTPYEQDSVFSFTIAVYNVGAIFGSLLVMAVVNRFGRRLSLFLACSVLSAVGSAIQCGGLFGNIYELLILGRFVSGVSSGLVTGVLPIYLTECSPVRYRGLVAGTLVVFVRGNSQRQAPTTQQQNVIKRSNNV